MKKVGMVVNSLGYGGNERSVENIANCISAFLDVSVIVLDGSQTSKTFGGKVINLDVPASENKLQQVLHSFVRAIRFKRVIRKNSLDFVYLFLPKTNLLNYLTYKSCKKIVSCRDCGDLINNTEKYNAMAEKSDLILFNSEYMRRYFLQNYPENAKKSRTVYNILDDRTIGKLKQEGDLDRRFCAFRSEKKKIVISVGRFCHEKGFNNLIKAFGLLQNKEDGVGLVIIGGGSLMESAKAMIQEGGLEEDVLLMGFQQNPYKYLSYCDVFALSSFSEGFPNVILEAMACGLPVVSTDCPSGPAELLSPGRPVQVTDGFERSLYGIRTENFEMAESDWNLRHKNHVHEVFANALDTLLKDEKLLARYRQASVERSADFSPAALRETWKNVFETV